MSTYHLVDTENMPLDWINLINIQSEDKILLFRLIDSQKNYVTLDDLAKIANENIHINIMECNRGKPGMNALDFQLVSYLGFLIGTNLFGSNTDLTIKIYTNDTGFEPVVEFWRNREIDIEIIKSN